MLKPIQLKSTSRADAIAVSKVANLNRVVSDINFFLEKGVSKEEAQDAKQAPNGQMRMAIPEQPAVSPAEASASFGIALNRIKASFAILACEDDNKVEKVLALLA